MAKDIEINDIAIFELVNSPPPDGLVAPLLLELAERAAEVARAVVHVRPGTRSSATTGRDSDAQPPGLTKASIDPGIGWDEGLIYGTVRAPADPAVFLEDPAEQLHESYPFLTTGLYSLEGTV